MSSPPVVRRQALSTRFLITFSVVYASLIVVLGFVVMLAAEDSLIEDLVGDQERETMVAATALPADLGEIQAWAADISRISGARITIIDIEGRVVADSHTDPAVMENHATRPEVVEALSGVVGRDERRSVSTGFEQSYVALPPQDGLIVRSSISERSIQDDLDPIRRVVVMTSLLVGLLGISIVALLARRLARPIEQLTSSTISLAAGDRDVELRRSRVREIDSLADAISTLVTQLEQRLRESEEASETLEVVLGALPQGTVLISGEGRVLYANPASYDLLGEVPEDVGEIVPYPFQQIVRRAQESGVPADDEVDHGRPTRRLRGVATPFADDHRVLLIVVDVTARERAASVRRDFVANASHELKTPVSSIIASSEALRIAIEKDLDSAGRFAGQIEASAMQLNRMVNDLLDLSRLERDQPELDPIEIHLLVVEEVERIRARAEEAGVDVKSDTAAAQVMGSRRDLAIAIRNLLENAVRHTPRGGEISVSTKNDGGEVLVSVADTGEGIPSRDHERVFERFYRVDSARSRESGGTGLGLAIVKHVVESHRGTVGLQSELGVGSTFTIRVPRRSA